jgi:hypothetical protein
MNLEKNLAEDKNFALLTQDIGAEVRRLAAPMKKHIQAWACSPRNSAPGQLWRARHEYDVRDTVPPALFQHIQPVAS